MKKLLSLLFALSLSTNAYAVCTANLLLHCNGADTSTTFTDSETTPKTFTAHGNAQIDTAQFKFGGASGLFDGTGDYADTGDSTDWDFGSGDFTIDMWLRWAAVASDKLIFEMGAPTSDGIRINPRASSTLAAVTINNVEITYSLDADWIQDQWYHLELTRNGTNLRFFKDGVSLGTQTNSATITNGTQGVTVGAAAGGSSGWNGWIDEVHVIKGTASHTGNFTPPTSEYCPTAGSWFFTCL